VLAALCLAPSSAGAFMPIPITCPSALCYLNPQPSGPAPTVSQPCPGQPTSEPGFTVGPPVGSANAAGNVSAEQTIAVGDLDQLELTAEQCWDIASSDTASAYGPIDLDGVWLVPASGNPQLVVTAAGNGSYAGGTVIRADQDSAVYYVEVPQNGMDPENILASQPSQGPPAEIGQPLVTVGQVDLGTTSGNVWIVDAGSGVIGSFSASPQGQTYDGRAIVGGAIREGVYNYSGEATVQLNMPLPGVFTTAPNGGSPITGALYYYGADFLAVLPQGSGGTESSQGGGGPPPNAPPNPCEYELFKSQGCTGIRYMQAPRRQSLQQPLTLSVPDMYFGGLEIQNATLSYDPGTDTSCGGLWRGGGSLTLLGYGLDAEQPTYGFNVCGNGQWEGGGAALTGDAPIIPGVLDLTQLGAAIQTNPTRLFGNAQLSVLGGTVTVPGCFLTVFADSAAPYHYNSSDLGGGGCSAPGSLQAGSGAITSLALGASGTAYLNVPVLGQVKLGNGYGFYIAPAYFEFGGNFNVSLTAFSVGGGVSGAMDLRDGVYNLEGNLNACIDWPSPIPNTCVNFDGILSSAGVGACGTIGAFGVNFGVYFRDEWSGGPSVGFGCDLGPITVSVQSARAAAAGAPLTVNVPAGVPLTSITLDGKRGPPLVTVSGPGGEQVSDTTAGQAAGDGSVVIAPLAGENETLIALNKPAAGTWTITPQPGSPEISHMSFANGVAAPRITASVAHAHGSTYTLTYSVRRRPRQTVVFAERAGSLFHVLSTARRDSGTLTFTAASSPIRSRSIQALISLGGLPNHDVTVATYTAPVPAVSRPGHVKVIHQGDELLVSWSAAGGAAAYSIAASLSDGRRLLFHAGARAGSVTIPLVSAGVGAQVSVLGVGPDGSRGPSGASQVTGEGAPPRVTGVVDVPTRKGVAVHWNAVRGAAEYVVHVFISGAVSGSLVAVSRSSRMGPSARLAALGRGVEVRIAVRAIAADGQIGPAGVLRYAPA
jgi:hypothetical protein